MEPITIATAFASLVGLVRLYKTEAQEQDRKVFDKYIEWLRRQEHRQLADLILGNDEITRSLREIVEDKHNEIIARLDSLNEVIGSVAAHIAPFQPLARAVRASALSGQAVSILRQLNAANSSSFLEIAMLGGNQYELLDGEGTIEFSEPRFADDDLLTLRDLRFLRLSQNESGGRIFTITRAGAIVGGDESQV
jgi:hypothetical protein